MALFLLSLTACLTEPRRAFFGSCDAPDQCQSGICFEAHCTSSCATASQCGTGGVCVKGYCAPRPPRVDLFRDDFADPKMAGWMPYGAPLPVWLPLFADHTGVVDTNGDGLYNSGAVSELQVVCEGGCTIEAEVYAGFTNLGGCWSDATIGLSEPAYAPGMQGKADQDISESVGLMLTAYGDKCWATPEQERRHMWIQAWMQSESGAVEQSPLIAADNFANRWTRLSITIAADRSVRFHANGQQVWAPLQPIAANVLKGRNLVIGRRSSGSAGKSYHDWVWVWR